MKLLSLDPASRCTGYAVMDSEGNIIDAGKLTGTGEDYLCRVVAAIDSLVAVIDEHQPGACVLEVPSGHVHGRFGSVRPRSQSVYGFAVGAFWQVAKRYCGRVHPVFVNEWTAGKPKPHRQKEVIARCPQYDPVKDKGMDVSDAIALGWWWLRRKEPQND